MKRNFAKIFTLAGLVVIFSLCAGVNAKAAERISVQIAPYYTEIDYMSVYSPGVEYPVFTCKNITYIPLTQKLSNRLGIAVDFDSEKGLYITKYNDMIYGRMPDDKPFGKDGTHFYKTNYSAVIPDYPIYVNGIFYNSHKEEYPFFNYKGITYLPLTYHLAYEELGLEIKFGDGKFYLNHMETKNSYVQMVTSKNGDTVILNQRSEATKHIDEFGQTVLFPFTWWEHYKLHTDTDFLERLGTYHSLAEFSDEYYPTINRDGENENIYTVFDSAEKKNNLYYKDEIIDTLPENADYFGREYIFDNTVFVYVNVYTNNSPAPYTSHEEYVYVKDANGTRKLSWDSRNNLVRVIPDGVGGYYLCSDYYSPHYSARWSTSFASVCHYTSDGRFYEVEIPDTNSITGYAVFDGKLYVKAMYYGADKNSSGYFMPTSAIKGGFYALDAKTENAKKLYPYIYGDVFTTNDGGFYCIYQGGAKPRLVNLITRRIIPVE